MRVGTIRIRSIGLGLPQAVGATAAEPGRPVVLTIGDGGFMLGGLTMFLLGNNISALIAVVCIPLLPFSRLAGHQRRRQEKIAADLPDFLDILSVTVSAGIGFRTALGRVAQRFEGPLREELQARGAGMHLGRDVARRGRMSAAGGERRELIRRRRLGRPLRGGARQGGKSQEESEKRGGKATPWTHKRLAFY